ncbi:MAG: MFS transporter [Chloroflexi bacterium]|nr:MAG: MFS transporter [Chloroflexota bacterium]
MTPQPNAMQRNVTRYYLYNFFLNFQLWWPIWIIYLKEERGLSQTQVTLIDVPFWLSIVLLQIPGAALADRWGRRPALIASGCAFALAITLFGLASTFPLLLLSYLVWGVAFSLFNGTESAFIYDTLKGMGREEEYQRIYGRSWALNMVAAVAGTLIGAPLAEVTSLPFPIVLSGAIAGLAALTALTFREPPRGEGPISHLSYPDVLRQSAQIVRRQAPVRYAILFVGVVAVGSIGPIFFFQPFLVEHGVDTGEVGLWQTPMRIAAIFGALAAHRITRDLGERGTFYLMPVVLVSSYLLLALWGSLYAQVAFLSLYFVMVMSQPVITDYVNRRVPSEQRATVVSLTNLVRALVLIPSAPLMGLLADNVSSTAPFWAGAILVAALSLPLLLLWGPLMRRGARAEPALAEAAGVASGD